MRPLATDMNAGTPLGIRFGFAQYLTGNDGNVAFAK